MLAGGAGRRFRSANSTTGNTTRAVFNGSARLLALAAVISYLGKFSLSRGFIGISLIATLMLSLVLRHLARRWLARQRSAGRFGDDLLVVGSTSSVANLVRTSGGRRPRATSSSAQWSRAMVLYSKSTANPSPFSAALIGSRRSSPTQMRDAIAIADPNTLGPGQLRQLAWHLEGSGVDLLVVPAITDFAGPRVNVRPAADLPLLHLEEPEFEGMSRLLKDAFDRIAGVGLLAVAAPLFLIVAFAVRFDSRPRVLSQRRVGRGGTEFECWKFRTMRAGADARKNQLTDLNDLEGVLFKIREDPRRTRIGRWSRRTSIDELPQLINVLRGDMSIVGPRPPVPDEVDQYGDDVRRRLLVKPGLTGLWQ